MNLHETYEKMEQLPENRRVSIIADGLVLNKDVSQMLNPNLTDDQFEYLCGSKYDNMPWYDGSYSTNQMRYIDWVFGFCPSIIDDIVNPSYSVPDMKKIVENAIKSGAPTIDNFTHVIFTDI